jgi:hypothetical protein
MSKSQLRLIRLLTLLGVMVLALVACATQPVPDAYNPPGFLLGLLHGFTCLFALIGELFTNYRIYAFPNRGGFYDLGFVIGAIAAFGGSAAAA